MFIIFLFCFISKKVRSSLEYWRQ